MSFKLGTIDGRAILADDAHWYDLESVSGSSLGADPMAALAAPDRLSALTAALGDHEPGGALEGATLGPPVPSPQKTFGIGLNYQDHAAESSMELPENPLVFTKFPSCLVGPTADVELRSGACDYEGELVVVIGSGGKDIAPEDAWDRIVGVTVGQDISDRGAQFAAKPPHFDLGKSFDTFGPTGPFVIPSSSVDPENLRIRTTVNGEVRQDGSTADLIFDVPTLVSYLSRITTLVTGDLIFTGTPEGVGAAKGLFLADGDVIETTIDDVGTMTNRCVRVSSYRQ
ncbi:MAG: fumarylacetoacetate hydrolase family protein [Actinomycetota bacterium]